MPMVCLLGQKNMICHKICLPSDIRPVSRQKSAIYYIHIFTMKKTSTFFHRILWQILVLLLLGNLEMDFVRIFQVHIVFKVILSYFHHTSPHIMLLLSKGPSIYYVKKITGWKMARLADVQYCIFAVGGWVRKSSKLCWRNIWTVPTLKNGLRLRLHSPQRQPITGKSFSEALILGSTNPKYGKRVFIELRVQYMKITSSEHIVYINCFCIDIQNNLCTQHL